MCSRVSAKRRVFIPVRATKLAVLTEIQPIFLSKCYLEFFQVFNVQGSKEVDIGHFLPVFRVDFHLGSVSLTYF